MGGMGGMGGGGGMFAVEDDLILGSQKSPAKNSNAKPGQADSGQTTTRLPAIAAKDIERLSVTVQVDQSIDDAWDALFAQRRFAKAEQKPLLDLRIRKTAGELSTERKFTDVISMLHAAVRQGHGRSWMYEAIGLAMLATDAPKADVERVLMSAVDLSPDPNDALEVAIYMSRVGLDSRALKLFRDIAFVNPFRPEPYALGLASAKRTNDAEGIKWATLGILNQAWPEDQSGVEDRALRIAMATVARLQEEGKAEEAAAFDAAITKARQRDVTVQVRWTGDADVDLMVEEPGGTVCSLQNPRTVAGGVMLGDAYSSGQQTEGYTETYVCPKGFNGSYRMLVHRVWGDVTAGKVTVDIHTANPDRPNIHAQVKLEKKDALVLFEVKQGRRTEMLAQHQLLDLNPKAAADDRALVSRQLNRYEDSLASRDFVRDRAHQRGFFGGRPVGFRPNITTLPQGSQLLPGTTAIVSADRRYVRASPQPFFSFIGEVNTFDFGGGVNNGLPDDDDDDNNNNN